MCRAADTCVGVKIAGTVLFCLTFFWHVSAFSAQLSDPTRPPDRYPGAAGHGTKAAPVWILSSTLIAPTRRLATINGKTVEVGDRIRGAEVLRIEPAQVSLRNGSKLLLLRLAPRDFKRPR